MIRSYTPELLMMRYTYGKISSHLFDLRAGKSLHVRGPVGHFKYPLNMYGSIGLICGGTGLTPCLQVIREILEGAHADKEDTKLVTLYQNRTQVDTLVRDSLCALQEQYSHRLQVFFYLSSPSEAGGRHHNKRRGYITGACMQALLPYKNTDLEGLCGPSGFNEAMARQLQSVAWASTMTPSYTCCGSQPPGLQATLLASRRAGPVQQ